MTCTAGGVRRAVGEAGARGDINNPPCYSYANAHRTIISGTRITRRYTDWKNSLTAPPAAADSTPHTLRDLFQEIQFGKINHIKVAIITAIQ